MALTLEEALTQLGELKGKVGSLESEVTTLRGHKERLETDLSKARQAKSDAETERDDLKTKVPGDDVRVLPKAEAEELDAYRALGKPAKELKEALERGTQAERTAHNATNREVLRQLGYEPSEFLLRQFEGVTVIAADGPDKKIKVGKIKAEDAEQPLTEWTKAQGLDTDLERYRSQPQGVQVLPQVNGGPSGPVTVEQRTEEKQQSGDYQL